jgi:hypothetical protein
MCIEALLEACRLSKEDPHLTDEALGDLTGAIKLTEQAADAGDTCLLAQAATLLTSTLSHVPRFKAPHLPLAACGSHTRSRPWVEWQRLEQINQQMVGLYRPQWEIEQVWE